MHGTNGGIDGGETKGGPSCDLGSAVLVVESGSCSTQYYYTYLCYSVLQYPK